jgi:hypothetical protein
MMKKLILSTSLIFSCFASPTLGSNYIRSFEAQGIEDGNYPVLTVWSGSGLTLDFTSLTGEFVKSIWLDDPSKLVLDYAGELCSLPCRGGVKIIHLKRVTGLHFPNLPSTAKTTLTVVTVSSSGDKVYKFILGYGSGTPQYFTVNVTPRQQISRPAVNQRLPPHSPLEVSPVPKNSSNALQSFINLGQSVENNSSLRERKEEENVASAANSEIKTTSVVTNDASVESEKPQLTSVTNTVEEEAPNSRQIANYIVRGLIVAAQKKQINYGTRTYRQVQSAVRALRRGNNLTQAVQISQVKLSVLEQLIAWGKE